MSDKGDHSDDEVEYEEEEEPIVWRTAARGTPLQV